MSHFKGLKLGLARLRKKNAAPRNEATVPEGNTPLDHDVIPDLAAIQDFSVPEGTNVLKYDRIGALNISFSNPFSDDNRTYGQLVLKSYCNICFNFLINGWNTDKGPPKLGLSNDPLISDLGRSGREGCQICKVLYEGCKLVVPWFIDTLHTDGKVQFAVGSYHIGSPRMILLVQNLATREQDYVEIFVEIGVGRISELRGLGSGRDVIKSRKDSYESLIRGWISECDQLHLNKNCGSVRSKLPDRVIYIGNGDGGDRQPYLHLSNDEIASYAALSHCWGTESFIRTKKSTLAQMQQEIPFESLPENFQDAIAIARSLGLQYLWIDALCIIQDDPLDWGHQSAEMCAIYNNAYIVLAATKAKNCDGGMLNQQKDEFKPSVEIATVSNGAGVINHIHARLSYNHQNPCDLAAGYPAQQSPLAQRAWAFQEQLLAIRTIHFTDTELIWECEQQVRCECMELDTRNENGRWAFNAAIKSQDKGIQFEGWREMVKSYTRRALTFETDRLPAFSGLAKQMQTYGAGRYLAGLWYNDLHRDLLWTTPAYSHRAVPYRGPSWSWVSLNSERGSQSYIMPSLPRGTQVNSIRTSILDAHCDPAGEDTTGAVTSGMIELSAPFLNAKADRPEPRVRDYCRSADAFVLCEGEKAYVKWDIELSKRKDNLVHIVLLGDALIGRHASYQGLVLQKSTIIDDAYERVGILSHNVNAHKLISILRNAPTRVVKIV